MDTYLLSEVIDLRVVLPILMAVLAAVAAWAIFSPMLATDKLTRRMRELAIERDKIKARGRISPMGRNDQRTFADNVAKGFVEKFSITEIITPKELKELLQRAGYRKDIAVIYYQFTSIVLPIITIFAVMAYFSTLTGEESYSFTSEIMIVIAAAYVAFRLPNLFVDQQIRKYQQSINRSFPDALDLLLICVSSGMSIEAGFRKVSEEIGSQSIPLAEELLITTAELSYLSDRRQALENLGNRTGLDTVRSVVTALIQAEKYGTSIGDTLKVLAQENRDQRMARAEKKAAALPPKLTVPMIVFTLPVLVMVILMPALIPAFGWR
jgi:tight adherence protein C